MGRQTVIFFGRPGAGKSTQFQLLAEYMAQASPEPLLPFRWSPMIRAFIQGDTFAQRHAKELVDAGELLPAFLAPSIWLPQLLTTFTGKEHLLVDGLPRLMIEAELLVSAMEFYNRAPVAIINLEIPADVAQARLVERGKTEGKKKDMELGTIQKRLAWFETEILPILEFLSNQPHYRLYSIDGTGSQHEVHKAIKTSLGI